MVGVDSSSRCPAPLPFTLLGPPPAALAAATPPPVDASSQLAFPFFSCILGSPGQGPSPPPPPAPRSPQTRGHPRLGARSRPAHRTDWQSRAPRGRRGLASVAWAPDGNFHPSRSLAPALPRLQPFPMRGADPQPHAVCHRGAVPTRPVTLAVPPPPRPQFPPGAAAVGPAVGAPESGPTPAPAGIQSGAAVRGLCPARGGASRRATRASRPSGPAGAGDGGAARAAGARLARSRGGGAGHGPGTRRPHGGGSERRGRRRPLAPCPAPPPSARSPRGPAGGGPAGGGPRPQVPGGGRARAGARGPGSPHLETQSSGGLGGAGRRMRGARGAGRGRLPRVLS